MIRLGDQVEGAVERIALQYIAEVKYQADGKEGSWDPSPTSTELTGS
jgi:hypothetical protein